VKKKNILLMKLWNEKNLAQKVASDKGRKALPRWKKLEPFRNGHSASGITSLPVGDSIYGKKP